MDIRNEEERKAQRQQHSQSDLHFLRNTSALWGHSQQSSHPCVYFREGHFMMCFSAACGLYFSRYSTSILQTSRDTCSGQGLTLTVASATGKLCCWMIQFLIATFYAPSDSQFLPLKKYQGTMSSKPLPKIWARGQRRRCGGRARQAKHRPLRLCFFFSVPGPE